MKKRKSSNKKRIPLNSSNKKKMPLNISNNVITTNVVWEKETIQAVNDIAKGLLNMTELFKSQNIEITGLKISQL